MIRVPNRKEEKEMRRLMIGVLPVLAILALPVFGAASPHFIGSPAISKDLVNGLSVSWKVAGQGSFTSAAFLTASTVTANYVCVNNGSNTAPGQPLVLSNVVGPTTNIPAANGQITFTVGIPPPATPSASTECPSHHEGQSQWTVMLTSLTFSDVTLHIQQGGQDLLTANLGTIDP